MSYETYEASVMAGEPIHLFDFYDDFGSHWRMTTAANTVSYGGYDYSCATVDCSEISVGNNDEVDAVDVKLWRESILAQAFIPAPIEGRLWLTIYRMHVDESNVAVYWQGILMKVSFDENGTPTMRFEKINSEVPSAGCRRCNQILCDKALYGEGIFGCRVDRAAFTVAGTIASITGVTIMAAEFVTKPDGWFIAGEFVTGNARRLIIGHSGNTITVSRSILTADINDTFTAYAGCDHTPQTCHSKFGNKYNYGGNEFLPVKNPYMTSIRV